MEILTILNKYIYPITFVFLIIGIVTLDYRRHVLKTRIEKLTKTLKEKGILDQILIFMEEKYIKFYQSFHKAFQNKKSNSLFELNQSQQSSFKSLFSKQFFLLIDPEPGDSYYDPLSLQIAIKLIVITHFLSSSSNKLTPTSMNS